MRPATGYPTSIGNHRESLCGIAGPASYTVVTAGATPSGGQVVLAEQFGLKALDVIMPGVTDSAQFFVEAIPITATVGANQSLSGTTYRLRWIARVTGSVGGQAQTAGSEAAALTDLSTQTVRLLARGLY